MRSPLRLLRERGHVCCVDAYVATEARRNLAAKGPQALHLLNARLADLEMASAATNAVASVDADWLPEKDRPVLAAAIRLRCDTLVTGDRTHFGAGYGKVFGGVTVHSPRSLAEHILG